MRRLLRRFLSLPRPRMSSFTPLSVTFVSSGPLLGVLPGFLTILAAFFPRDQESVPKAGRPKVARQSCPSHVHRWCSMVGTGCTQDRVHQGRVGRSGVHRAGYTRQGRQGSVPGQPGPCTTPWIHPPTPGYPTHPVHRAGRHPGRPASSVTSSGSPSSPSCHPWDTSETPSGSLESSPGHLWKPGIEPRTPLEAWNRAQATSGSLESGLGSRNSGKGDRRWRKSGIFWQKWSKSNKKHQKNRLGGTKAGLGQDSCLQIGSLSAIPGHFCHFCGL